MKKLIYITAAFLILISGAGCKKWLDVNTNPNAPQKVAANLYLAPILNNLILSQPTDGRYVGKYIQNWAQNATQDTWDRHGYLYTTADPAGEQWRAVYFLMGHNLIDMMRIAEEEQRWDLLGIGYILKAWGWQQLTDYHGEIILTQAFDLSRKTFDYDTQDVVYKEIERLINLGIDNLKRTDGAVSQSYLTNMDLVYQGDRTKWLKFAYGFKAMSLNHLSLKGTLYRPQEVIDNIDLAFLSNADDAKMTFLAAANATSSFWAPARDNLTLFRQTNFAVNLMNGTQFGGAVDPRLRRILWPSADGNVYGIDPTFGNGALLANQIPPNLWGSTTFGPTLPGNYIFTAKGPYPLMTYSQLQFIKAEAAFKLGRRDDALTAYKNGISSHIDFVNTANATAANPAVTQITAIEKSTFLASAAIPATGATLRLSDIMSQKYIAQYGWGLMETWTDLRRYHYMDTDPEVPAVKVFKGFTIPANDRLFPDNQFKPVYRVRPRYNSEWVWNLETLKKIGGDKLDYHTQIMWLFQP
ncbi:MAG: SusD/RagB family nutrient-binding outer membrane lipoprotein [Pedobacter sp.]|nr:MAG: SusD/RagB family nutrient-binding outer membrane lipoprotein [Pedobacter sp.]